MSLSEIRKAVATLIGVTLLVLNEITSFGLPIPATWQHAISAVVALLTVVSTYVVPNKPAAVA